MKNRHRTDENTTATRELDNARIALAKAGCKDMFTLLAEQSCESRSEAPLRQRTK